MEVKYVFVTGGVVSGLGKGITASSLGRLLKARGYRVTMQKIDPYINVDAGIMSPLQHGEVFVTEDGAETDLDMGHYERFIDQNLTANSSITAGKVYYSVLKKERSGKYNGRTVQVIPHITDEIKSRIFALAQSDKADIVISEIGGTIGDIEGLPFIEAIRQIAAQVGRQNVVFVHVTLVPYISGSKELKSKPTQHSVKTLLSQGVQPDVIVCRTNMELPPDMREKIALFCNIRPCDVIQNKTASCIYELPLLLEKEGLANAVCHHLGLENRKPDLTQWQEIVNRINKASKKTTIGIVGKYVELQDAYLSLVEALSHACIANDCSLDIRWIKPCSLLKGNAKAALYGCNGIIASGSYGEDKCGGYIECAQYARENNIPYLGISLGAQAAVIEFARNVLNLTEADSTEFNPKARHPVVYRPNKGTRLGSCDITLMPDSLCFKIYGCGSISERHRTRYEINPDYNEPLKKAGMKISGMSGDNKYIETIEILSHPWFVGVQYNAELKSRPNRPHPLFTSFVKAALNQK